MNNRRDRRADDGHEQGDRQARLERDHVDREECRTDQLLMRSIAARDEHRVAMAAQDVGLLLLSQRPAELLGSVFHLREQILRQLADDVVLLTARQKKPNGLKIPVEQIHDVTPKEVRRVIRRCSATRRRAASASAGPCSRGGRSACCAWLLRATR